MRVLRRSVETARHLRRSPESGEGRVLAVLRSTEANTSYWPGVWRMSVVAPNSDEVTDSI